MSPTPPDALPTVPPDDIEAGPPDVVPGFVPGDDIGQYRVRHHTPGGMNDVYLCVRYPQQYAALKLPRSAPGRARVFLDEVRSWSELDRHPNLVDLLHVGTFDAYWFLVLEWVGAPDLPRDLYALVDERDLIAAAIDVCDGLTYVHGHGVVHGDLKPSNVLLDGAGIAKITDLGVSSLARATGRLGGTPQYMAPELWDGGPRAVQTDLYALGCLLFELLTRRIPFAGDGDELGRRHRQEAPPRLESGHADLDRLVAECLAKDPAARPASAAQIRDRLASLLPEGRPAASAAAAGARINLPDDRRAGWRMSILHAAGRHDEALAEQSEVLRAEMRDPTQEIIKKLAGGTNPGLAWQFNTRGCLIAEAGDYIRAIRDFTSAIRLDPRLAVAHANLGACFQLLDELPQALASLNRAAELDPADPRLVMRRARLLAGQSWHASARKDFALAADLLQPVNGPACWDLADALFALDRDEEAERHRARARDLGAAGGQLDWLRPDRTYDNREHLSAMASASFGDHAKAVRLYTAALQRCPWELGWRYHRAESLLELGDTAAALRDLDAFLDDAPTTHPRRPKALTLRRNGGNHADDPLPTIKGHVYISRYSGVLPTGATIVNLVPVSDRQRTALLDMLYGGDPDRADRAEDLLWAAFDEQLDEQTAFLRRHLSDLPEQEAHRLAFESALCESAGLLAMTNGLGPPVLLSEAVIASGGITALRYLDAEPPSFGWCADGEAGVWSVQPAHTADAIDLRDGARVVGFAADGSAYLVIMENVLGVLTRAGGDDVAGWRVPGGRTAVSACLLGEGRAAVGLANASVVLLAPDGEPPVRLRLLADGPADAVVALGGDGVVRAYCGGRFARLDLPSRDSGPGVRSLPVPYDGTYRLLAFDGTRAVLRTADEELVLLSLADPVRCVSLRPRDATDEEGFMAAAVSSDGDMVAAACGSFLHVWRRDEPGSEFTALPIAPQLGASCLALSPDGGYLAVGTTAGSLVIFCL